jgi:hypothetical protein
MRLVFNLDAQFRALCPKTLPLVRLQEIYQVIHLVMLEPCAGYEMGRNRR